MAENKSDTKYQNAVDKARGNTPQVMDPQAPPPASSGAMVKSYHPDALKKKLEADLASGAFESAPQIYTLKVGEVIEDAILEGNGPVAEFVAKDGTVSHVQTWILADATGASRISILSSVQLDRKLIGFIGQRVNIARGEDVNIGNGQRMTEYLVWGPKLPNGQKRQWFELSNETRAQIEAQKQHQLPAGNSAS